MDLTSIGRMLVLLGIVTVVIGLVLTFAGRIPLIGRMPGDFEIRGDGWTVYLPIATSILLSVALTVVLALVGWLGGRR